MHSLIARIMTQDSKGIQSEDSNDEIPVSIRLNMKTIVMIDNLAKEFGMTRSETTKKLIDELFKD
jgi:hypothetical protein